MAKNNCTCSWLHNILVSAPVQYFCSIYNNGGMLMLWFFCVKQGVSQKEFPWLIIMHTPVSHVALMHQAAIYNCILVAHFLLFKNKDVMQPRGAVLYHTLLFARIHLQILGVALETAHCLLTVYKPDTVFIGLRQ